MSVVVDIYAFVKSDVGIYSVVWPISPPDRAFSAIPVCDIPIILRFIYGS